jgi:hypothetical protein
MATFPAASEDEISRLLARGDAHAMSPGGGIEAGRGGHGGSFADTSGARSPEYRVIHDGCRWSVQAKLH